jgi:hypothetical protein
VVDRRTDPKVSIGNGWQLFLFCLANETHGFILQYGNQCGRKPSKSSRGVRNSLTHIDRWIIVLPQLLCLSLCLSLSLSLCRSQHLSCYIDSHGNNNQARHIIKVQ